MHCLLSKYDNYNCEFEISLASAARLRALLGHQVVVGLKYKKVIVGRFILTMVVILQI